MPESSNDAHVVKFAVWPVFANINALRLFEFLSVPTKIVVAST